MIDGRVPDERMPGGKAGVPCVSTRAFVGALWFRALLRAQVAFTAAPPKPDYIVLKHRHS